MNRPSSSFVVHATLALAVLSFAGSTFAQGADCPAAATWLQHRLLAKAGESPAALRQFIYIRRAILQIDIGETQAWADAVLAAHPECGSPTAGTTAPRDAEPAVQFLAR
jgi:hypothetical protein